MTTDDGRRMKDDNDADDDDGQKNVSFNSKVDITIFYVRHDFKMFFA